MFSMFRIATISAPASTRRWVTTASIVGTKPCRIREAHVRGTPATAMFVLEAHPHPRQRAVLGPALVRLDRDPAHDRVERVAAGAPSFTSLVRTGGCCRRPARGSTSGLVAVDGLDGIDHHVEQACVLLELILVDPHPERVGLLADVVGGVVLDRPDHLKEPPVVIVGRMITTSSNPRASRLRPRAWITSGRRSACPRA